MKTIGCICSATLMQIKENVQVNVVPICVTGQMSVVETGQVSAVETGQISAAGRGHMSRIDVCC